MDVDSSDVRVLRSMREVVMRLRSLGGLCAILGALSCQYAPTNKETGASGPTWHQDVAPFVTARCVGCHHNDDNFAFPLTSFSEASPMASWMLEKMEGDDSPPYFMPPFAARDSATCEPPVAWKEDPRPTADELAMFRAWVDAGTPEGDPATAAPLEVPTAARLEGSDIQGLTLAGYTLEAGSYEDEYRCFPIDLERTQSGWLDGFDVLPDNDDVLHHVLIYMDPDQAGRDRAGGEGSYPCFGGTGLANASLAYAWAPGIGPLDLAGEAGVSVPAGGGLIAQVHYHPTGEEERDATQIEVRWSDGRPRHETEFRVLGGVSLQDEDSPNWSEPPFRVPVGATEHRETWVETLDIPPGVDVRIASVFPHMHLAGTSIEVRLERAGEDICLASLPAWDFEWQRTYLYEGAFEDLPKLEPGDRLRIECTYNNSVSNPILMQYAEPASLQDIVVGENSLDEMCTVIVGVRY